MRETKRWGTFEVNQAWAEDESEEPKDNDQQDLNH